MSRLTRPLLLAGALLALAPTTARAGLLRVHWMPGFAAPGTPACYDKVGVITDSEWPAPTGRSGTPPGA